MQETARDHVGELTRSNGVTAVVAFSKRSRFACDKVLTGVSGTSGAKDAVRSDVITIG